MPIERLAQIIMACHAALRRNDLTVHDCATVAAILAAAQAKAREAMR